MLEYFTSSHGARKGMIDTALKTANSGYLTRRLVDVAQDCVVSRLDCGTSNGVVVKDISKGGDIVSSLSDRILGRTAQGDILHPDTNEILVRDGELITEADCANIEEAGVTEVKIRSVLTCECKDGICAKCYGRDLARGALVNIGEAVGVIAAQSIGEPGTQLTMRTFHVGGTAQKGAEMSSIESSFEGTVSIVNNHVVMDRDCNKIVMNRHLEVVVSDAKGRERARMKVPYGARLHVSEGDMVERGQKIADWDPFTTPVITERDGIVRFIDLIEGISLKQSMDEATGMTTYVVSDWRQSAKNADLKPMVLLTDENGKPIILPNGLEARFMLTVDAVLPVGDGDKVRIGDVIARLPRESSKSKDITGGLPRVSELFEARMPKDPAVLSDVAGYVSFGKDFKGKRRILVTPQDGVSAPMEYLVAKWRQLAVQEGDMVNIGDVLVEGNVAPHDILQILGVEALADYIVNEIQDVYRLQGVKINDKHIEVIVRRMLQKEEIVNPGDTTFIAGENVDAIDLEEENAKVRAIGGVTATTRPILQGITKASLQTRSFISAASFQETTRVLTDAAISGKVDELTGLKENVLVGRLIPAGTGFVINQVKRMAMQKDREFIEQQKALSSEA